MGLEFKVSWVIQQSDPRYIKKMAGTLIVSDEELLKLKDALASVCHHERDEYGRCLLCGHNPAIDE